MKGVFVLFLLMATGAMAEALPSGLIGLWQVKEVHALGAHGAIYVWDDPRLKWRLFDFQAHAVSNDVESLDDTCKSPVAGYATMSFRDLILRSTAGTPVNAYELKVDVNKAVKVIGLTCADGPWHDNFGSVDGTDIKIANRHILQAK